MRVLLLWSTRYDLLYFQYTKYVLKDSTDCRTLYRPCTDNVRIRDNIRSVLQQCDTLSMEITSPGCYVDEYTEIIRAHLPLTPFVTVVQGVSSVSATASLRDHRTHPAPARQLIGVQQCPNTLQGSTVLNLVCHRFRDLARSLLRPKWRLHDMRLWLFYSCFSCNLKRQPSRSHSTSTALKGALPCVDKGIAPPSRFRQ